MPNLKIKKGQPAGMAGYSLIEILVVLGVFAILATLATQAVAITLRSAKKSETSIKIKENLNYSMGVMERQLRNAKSVGSSCSANRVDYVDNSGNASYFSCSNASGDYYVASGSAARLTSTDVKVTPCSITCSSTSVTVSLTGTSPTVTGVENTTENVSSTIILRQGN